MSQIVVCKQLLRVGLELAALGLREKRLDLLLSQIGALFLINPRVVEALHSSRDIAPPKSSRLEDFESRGVAGRGYAQ